MPMRKCFPLLALMLVTGCSESGDQQQLRNAPMTARAPTMDVSYEAVQPPAVSPTAAPGVAFNYRYAFRLPAERVATVQEQHAQACEKLGLSRCRITGMRYRLVNERDIEAMLAFKLDPAIARQFGKQGIDTVAAAEGMLVDSEISGTDAGAGIDVANRNLAGLAEDLDRIEAQLARGGLPAEERARLQSEAQRLREAMRANRASREEQQASLATTPMAFNYGSGNLVPGFDTRSPLLHALEQAWDNVVGGVAVMLLLLVSVAPWALLALLIWWAVRRLRPRFGLGLRDEPLPAS
jgi:hypothetical protein